jgi:glycosyltransferase involved in cell wall biosynthesis
MPAYNAANYIQEAIDSVINQTFVDWELIIVDDGSTDHTKEVITKNVLVDERIHYYYQENGKQGKARNLAISKSKGTYLAFLMLMIYGFLKIRNATN